MNERKSEDVAEGGAGNGAGGGAANDPEGNACRRLGALGAPAVEDGGAAGGAGARCSAGEGHDSRGGTAPRINGGSRCPERGCWATVEGGAAWAGEAVMPAEAETTGT